MKPLIRYRVDESNEDELEVAERHCDVVRYLDDVGDGRRVFARYAALPFYREVEHAVKRAGSELVNTYEQHLFVADISKWSVACAGITPRTWSARDLPHLPEVPEHGYVLKGATNSKKFMWDTHMFARTRRDAIDVMCRLQDDSLTGTQEIVVREYAPLRRLADGLRGLPISEEYRFFVLDSRILCGGFYWSSHAEDLAGQHDWHAVPESMTSGVIARVGDRCSFYAMDIARTAAGEWILVELNDGQMSGPSECDLDALYAGIARI